MGLLGTVSEIVDDMGPDQESPDEPRSKGAYWCTDCDVRIRDVEYDGEGTPSCPECGLPMTFERRPDSGSCAC